MPKAIKGPTTSRPSIAKVRCRLRETALSSRDISLALRSHPDAAVFRAAKLCVQVTDHLRPLDHAMLTGAAKFETSYLAALDSFDRALRRLEEPVPKTLEGVRVLMQAVVTMTEFGEPEELANVALATLRSAVAVGV